MVYLMANICLYPFNFTISCCTLAYRACHLWEALEVDSDTGVRSQYEETSVVAAADVNAANLATAPAQASPMATRQKRWSQLDLKGLPSGDI